MASVERLKRQIKGPVIQSTLKRKIGYGDENKRNTRVKPSTENNEDMDISVTGSRV